MAQVIKSPRFALLAMAAVLLTMVLMTTPAAPVYAAACTSAMTNCNSWAFDGNCCGPNNIYTHQKRTCCDWQQVCCTKSRCLAANCPI